MSIFEGLRIFKKTNYMSVITKAREDGYRQALSESNEKIKRLTAQKNRELEIAVAEKDAVIAGYIKRIQSMQQFVDKATSLGIVASHYITHARALISEKTAQSYMFVELSAQAHQQQLILDQHIKDLADRASIELAEHRKALEAC
jgi:hypothetical protein